MIIKRYIAKEIFTYFVSLTLILLLILLSHFFVKLLTAVAVGKYPAGFLLKMIILEIPGILSILIPLGLYLAILFVLGRMYVDREIIAIVGSGISEGVFIKISLFFALLIGIVVSFLSLYSTPESIVKKTKLRTEAKASVVIDMLTPGNFHSISGGKKVVYVQDLNSTSMLANKVFLAQKNRKLKSSWDIITSNKAHIAYDQKNDRKFIVLEDGYRYVGVPGQKNFQIIQFAKYGLVIPDTTKPVISNSIRSIPSLSLLTKNSKFSDPERLAELQWRISLPISVILLCLLAIPMGRLKAHQGKYGKMFPAVLVYIIYTNLIFGARDLIKTQKAPIWLGIWWVHALLLILFLGIYFAPAIKRYRVNKGMKEK